jgi:HlyD family secretion protein
MFSEGMKRTSNKIIEVQTRASILASTPKIIIEFFAFSSIILYIIYEEYNNDNQENEIFGSLIFILLTGFKILPNINQFYSNLVTIKANIYALESIIEDLKVEFQNVFDDSKISFQMNKPIRTIELKDVVFKYAGTDKPILDKLCIEIPVGLCVGIVGTSGVGKSTLINILLGLLIPHEGELIVNNLKITKENAKKWRESVGFVPQSFGLLNGTVAQNIRFDYVTDEKSNANIALSLENAGLSEFVENITNGHDFYIGKNGGNLSGGQRQRIAIARAIYHESEILVFDEATSSLDQQTEKIIIKFIQEIKHKSTIIIVAHTQHILKSCDVIYEMKNGKIFKILDRS